MEGITINLKHYCSVVGQLAYKAACITKECAENPDLKKYEKKVNDPVTQADFKIQTMLIRGLHHFFPQLKIIGEQSTEYEGHIDLDVAQISTQTYPKQVQIEENVPIDEVCVWIDPIDNTTGFLNGHLDCVTILIGMSRKQRAYLGVVGLPYIEQNEQNIFKPEIVVGFAQQKRAFTSFNGTTWKQIFKPKLHTTLQFVISGSRAANKYVDELVIKHEAILHKVGGSGKKGAMVFKGEMDALLYIRANNHKWDSCAPEAIVQALGGFFTDIYGHPIPYDPQAKSTINDQGNIVIMDQALFQNVINVLKQANI